MILSHHKQAHGFALIATISVMVLLVMIALAMLSLSTIELRASQNGRAMAEAQANARMALMIAIGELQKHAGADTRVTASADIIADDNPPLLGVWKSWEGSDHEQSGTFAGRPIAPDYASKAKNLSDDGRFISWLVSGGNERAEITATNTFVNWIDGFGLDPADQDFDDDPDLDRLSNGLESWLGTHPGQYDAGLADLATDGTTTTFSHPQNDDPPSDVSGYYEWSQNLSDWYGSGSGPGGGPTVSFVPNTVGTTTTVTAAASEALEQLFLRVGVVQN